MNKFERGQDPKSTIGIGAENVAIDIQGIVEHVKVSTRNKNFLAHRNISDSYTILFLLSLSEDNQIEKHRIFKICQTWWDPGFGFRKRYSKLDNFKGKWVRFREHIYYIPK